MVLLFDNLFLDVVSVLTAFIAILLSWIKWKQTFWERKGIPAPPVNMFFGSMKRLFFQTESFAEFTSKSYNYFKKENVRHGGLYLVASPSYMPIDLDIVKRIMQTDFDHFVDRGLYNNEEGDPLSANLFNLEGTKWKNLRAKLTPTFTSGKMKMMFETLVKCGDQLKVEMDEHIEMGPINIKEILVRFTTDVIGNVAFGLDCNSLKNPDNEFIRYMNLAFIDTFKENLVNLITFVAPNLSKKLGLKTTKPAVEEFFMGVVRDTVAYREKNNIYRKDFMHLLLQLKNRGKLSDDESILGEGPGDSDGLTLNVLAAQAFVFFLAGFETSSTTMTFCLFELACNPDIQEKVREEIEAVLEKHDNKLTYDAIMEMHYMEKVINETLRKYPPLPLLNRVCTKDYKVPGTDVLIPKGMQIAIPVVGIQRDPEYYPDPEKFDPERFSEEQKRNRHHFAFFPFGEGPRVCIGLRFGMMQTKVGLSVMLKNYKFSLSEKTNVPLTFDPKNFIMSTKGGIWLNYVNV